MKTPADQPAGKAAAYPEALRTALLVLIAAAAAAGIGAMLPDLLAQSGHLFRSGAVQSALGALALGIAFAIVLAAWPAADNRPRPGALAMIGTFSAVVVTNMALLVLQSLPSAATTTAPLLQITGLITAAGILAAALSVRRAASSGNPALRWGAAGLGCIIALLLVGLAVVATAASTTPHPHIAIATTGLALCLHLAAAGILAASLRRPYSAGAASLLLAAILGGAADLFIAAPEGQGEAHHVSAALLRVAALVLVYRAVLWRAFAAPSQDEELGRVVGKAFASSPDGIIIGDAWNRTVTVNPGFIDMTGYSAVEALGMNPRILSAGPQDEAVYEAIWSEVRSHGRWRGELWDRRRNGDRYCKRLSITAVRSQGGEVTHYVAIISDITATKAAEENLLRVNAELAQAVEERTRRLTAANEELAAFNYSVSHDLRAPLRSIEGFSRVVASTYAARLDDTGRDYLQRIDHAVRRMNRLIDDLLRVSRISMSELTKSRVDLTALAKAILAEFASATASPRNIELCVEENLTIDADPGLARITLENLLANAWKFTSRTALARIEVCALPPGEGAGFLVRDNGAGFDMTYAGKLFGAFQRLHGSAEFEGTGVGLAIVRRIANLHGWTTRAEGEPGKGAVFRILTPQA